MYCDLSFDYSPFDMESPHHPPTENDTKVHNITYKEDVLPFSYSMCSGALVL